jgi:hypothetical protein
MLYYVFVCVYRRCIVYLCASIDGFRVSYLPHHRPNPRKPQNAAGVFHCNPTAAERALLRQPAYADAPDDADTKAKKAAVRFCFFGGVCLRRCAG